jgi:hypothetical protein
VGRVVAEPDVARIFALWMILWIIVRHLWLGGLFRAIGVCLGLWIFRLLNGFRVRVVIRHGTSLSDRR